MKEKTKKHIDLLDGESYQIRKIKDKLQVCIHCGCIPKPDEWSSETLCINCINTDLEEVHLST